MLVLGCLVFAVGAAATYAALSRTHRESESGSDRIVDIRLEGRLWTLRGDTSIYVLDTEAAEPFLEYERGDSYSAGRLRVDLYADGRGQATFSSGFRLAGTHSLNYDQEALAALLRQLVEAGLWELDTDDIANLRALSVTDGAPDAGWSRFRFRFEAGKLDGATQLVERELVIQSLRTFVPQGPELQRAVDALRRLALHLYQAAEAAGETHLDATP